MRGRSRLVETARRVAPAAYRCNARSTMRDYVIIFGAGVSVDGSPSPTLRHRIEGAIGWSRRNPMAVMMPTGGVGRVGPAEAVVIERELLAAGIEPSHIVVEPTGRDTLESVRRCNSIIKERGNCGRVIVCTSTYHQPRCALLFRLLGYRVAVAPVSSTLDRLSVASYAKAVAKEVIATPYDSSLLLLRLGAD